LWLPSALGIDALALAQPQVRLLEHGRDQLGETCPAPPCRSPIQAPDRVS
jgi:hypothetical protein